MAASSAAYSSFTAWRHSRPRSTPCEQRNKWGEPLDPSRTFPNCKCQSRAPSCMGTRAIQRQHRHRPHLISSQLSGTIPATFCRMHPVPPDSCHATRGGRCATMPLPPKFWACMRAQPKLKDMVARAQRTAQCAQASQILPPCGVRLVTPMCTMQCVMDPEAYHGSSAPCQPSATPCVRKRCSVLSAQQPPRACSMACSAPSPAFKRQRPFSSTTTHLRTQHACMMHLISQRRINATQ